MEDEILQEIVRRVEAGERFGVGLLAHVQGSAPQKAGARLIVLPNGALRGTVGGGCLEMEARRRALIALRTGESELFELRLDDDFGWDDGLICGGRTTLLVSPHPERMALALAKAVAACSEGRRADLVTVLAAPNPAAVGSTYTLLPEDEEPRTDLPFSIPSTPSDKPAILEREGWRVLVEPVRPRPTLIVMGCGHIGTALVEMAAGVGFNVIAVDDRADYASSSRLPGAQRVICDDMLATAQSLASGPDTYWVIVTRGHRNDGRVLAEVINRDYAYIGMIGSRRKLRIIREGLLTEGITTPERLARLHSPVGLDIGAESPQEIALSIAAELIAVRRGRNLRTGNKEP